MRESSSQKRGHTVLSTTPPRSPSASWVWGLSASSASNHSGWAGIRASASTRVEFSCSTHRGSTKT